MFVADQDAPAEQPEAQQAAEPTTDETPADQSMEELTKLKGLLDACVLTQAEIGAQKQKILQAM